MESAAEMWANVDVTLDGAETAKAVWYDDFACVTTPFCDGMCLLASSTFDFGATHAFGSGKDYMFGVTAEDISTCWRYADDEEGNFSVSNRPCAADGGFGSSSGLVAANLVFLRCRGCLAGGRCGTASGTPGRGWGGGGGSGGSGRSSVCPSVWDS